MAFDWESVEGYKEDLTAEEKLALLDNYEAPAPAAPEKADKVVSKAQYDKVASQLSDLKKELRSRMTKDEADAADREAANIAMRDELAALKKDKALSDLTKHYLKLGYEPELADLIAQAESDGDGDAKFAAMQKHQANLEKKLREQILKDTPVPPAGDDASKEAIRKKQEMNILRESMGLPPLK